MEEDIRAFEAGTDTGNYVLDTILTAKTLQCQRGCKKVPKQKDRQRYQKRALPVFCDMIQL